MAERHTVAAMRSVELNTHGQFAFWAKRPGPFVEAAGYGRRLSMNFGADGTSQRRYSGDHTVGNQPGGQNHLHELHQQHFIGQQRCPLPDAVATIDNACQKMLSEMCRVREHRTGSAHPSDDPDTSLSKETVAMAVMQAHATGEKHVWMAANRTTVDHFRQLDAGQVVASLVSKGMAGRDDAGRASLPRAHPAARGDACGDAAALPPGLQRHGARADGNETGTHQRLNFGTSKPACVGCGPFIKAALDHLSAPTQGGASRPLAWERRDFQHGSASMLYHTTTTKPRFMTPVETAGNSRPLQDHVNAFTRQLQQQPPATTVPAGQQPGPLTDHATPL